VKLLFSETNPDYGHYLYPYVVWGFLEPGETPADAFGAGFLPSAPDLSRFYLVRQLRVPLGEWKPTSENRRILRKGAGFECELIAKPEFLQTEERVTRWLAYAEERFGPGVMPPERLSRVFGGAVISHVLHFVETATGRELGTVLMHLQSPRVAYYYYAFYDLSFTDRHLGMFMMTRAAEYFAQQGFTHLYLGTCVTPKALYKVQFEPLEFFNGMRWSRNLDELKHLVGTDCPGRHRLDTPEFLDFQPGQLPQLADASAFQAVLAKG
jgi:arginyl-tRNA--protein-N-Asp/Glu arginylyltransferase